MISRALTAVFQGGNMVLIVERELFALVNSVFKAVNFNAAFDGL